MWDDLFLPLSSRCRGRYPALLQNTPPPRWRAGRSAGRHGWLPRGGHLSCVFILCLGFCKYRPDQNLETHLGPVPPPHLILCTMYVCFKTGKSIEVYIFNEGIEIWKKTRLKVHKNYILSCDFIALISHNIKTLKAKAFTHRMLISSCVYFDKLQIFF